MWVNRAPSCPVAPRRPRNGVHPEALRRVVRFWTIRRGWGKMKRSRQATWQASLRRQDSVRKRSSREPSIPIRRKFRPASRAALMLFLIPRLPRN